MHQVLKIALTMSLSSAEKITWSKWRDFILSKAQIQLWKEDSDLLRMFEKDLLPCSKTFPSAFLSIQEAQLSFMFLSQSKPMSHLNQDEGGGFHPKMILFFFSRSMACSCFYISLIRNQWSTSWNNDVANFVPTTRLPWNRKLFLFFQICHRIQRPLLLI